MWQTRDGVLVRLEREDGCFSFGEIAPIERFGTETIAGAVAWCASIGARIEANRLREIPRGLPCCVAALESALAGLEATPSTDGNPTSKATIPVACLLPAGSTGSEALARASDAGFQTFKLKIGTADFATEHANLARLVDRLPAGGRLRLDANGGLDLRTASRWLDAAADWPVEFIEQPLPVSADRDLVRLAHDHATAIALDESVRDADDVKRWRDQGWAGLFVIKPGLAGRHDELLNEVRIMPDAFVFSSALETAIGTAPGVRLAFTAGVTRALGYGVGAFFEDDGLGGGIDRASLRSVDVTHWNLEETWNRL